MKSFFSVPKKVHHGLLLVTFLAEHSDEAVSLEEISLAGQVSQGFLEEIAGYLRAAGIIVGKRGAGGGYVLGRAPAEITVADVVTAIEGPLTMVECLSADAGCTLAGACTNKSVWGRIQSRLLETMRSMSVADIAGAKVTAK